MSPRCALAVFLCLLPLPGAASAQGSVSTSGRVVYLGLDAYTVVQRWQGRNGAIDVIGPTSHASVPIDAPAYMAAAASAEGILIATSDVERPAVRAIWVPVLQRRLGRPTTQAIERPAAREALTAVGISVTARPDGFAVWWQEAASDANSTWRTFEARLDGTGRTATPPRALTAVPWPIADVAYVSPGSTFLLLYYAAGAPNATRLCAVRIADGGTAMEHPWWASRPGMIGEAQLTVAAGRAIAVYRGGEDGSTLLEADVTTGGWAREAPEPSSHGRIAPSEIFGARADGSRVRVEHRPPIARR